MKYAILLNEQEYYKYIFQSGKKHDNVQCFSGMTDFFSPIEMTLRRIHMWLIRHCCQLWSLSVAFVDKAGNEKENTDDFRGPCECRYPVLFQIYGFLYREHQ